MARPVIYVYQHIMINVCKLALHNANNRKIKDVANRTNSLNRDISLIKDWLLFYAAADYPQVRVVLHQHGDDGDGEKNYVVVPVHYNRFYKLTQYAGREAWKTNIEWEKL